MAAQYQALFVTNHGRMSEAVEQLNMELVGKKVRAVTTLYGLLGDTTPAGTTGVIQKRTHYPVLIVQLDAYAWADYDEDLFEVIEEE